MFTWSSCDCCTSLSVASLISFSGEKRFCNGRSDSTGASGVVVSECTVGEGGGVDFC